MTNTSRENHSFVRKYTDDKYFSKNDLKAKFNDKYIEMMWINVKEYRKPFKSEIPLINSLGREFYITLSPKMVQNEITLHKLFSQLEIKFYLYNNIWEKYETKSLISVKNDFILSETLSICKAYDMKIEETILMDVINYKYKSPDLGHEFASTIYHFFYSLEDSPTLNTKYLINWYKKLTNEKSDENIFRKKTLTSEIKTLQGNLERGFSPDSLSEKMKEINNFSISDNYLNTFVKATTAYYFIKYGKFFEKYNELMGIISFYTIISEDYPKTASQLGIVSLITKNYPEFENSFIKSVSDKDDITYFVRYFLENTIKAVQNLLDNYTDLLSNSTKKSERDNFVSINVKSKLLLSKNPNLSEKQARFYLSHNDPDSHYTISDFREYCDTSYETSRYSLDNLIKEGLYEKQKIGKKFVYKIKS